MIKKTLKTYLANTDYWNDRHLQDGQDFEWNNRGEKQSKDCSINCDVGKGLSPFPLVIKHIETYQTCL